MGSRLVSSAWTLVAANALCLASLAAPQAPGKPEPAVQFTLVPSTVVAAVNEVIGFEVHTLGIDGGPLEGMHVSFEVVQGPNQGVLAVGTTAGDGTASFLLANEGGTGTDQVLARLLLRTSERAEFLVEAHASVAWTCSLSQFHYGWPTLGAGTSPQVEVGSCFYMGHITEIHVTGSQPMAPSWLLIGLDQDYKPFAGGSLFVDPLIVLPFFTDPGGNAQLNLSLPDNPAFQGSGVYFQALTIDGGAAGGLAMSDGLQAFFSA